MSSENRIASAARVGGAAPTSAAPARNPRTTWAEAHRSEADFWSGQATHADTVTRSLARFAAVTSWAEGVAPELVGVEGRFAELGIGPVGLGCIHFLRGADRSELVGVDPLPRAGDEVLHPAVAPIRRALERGRTAYLVEKAERTSLESDRFDVVVSYNCIDHAEDGAAIVAEAHRLLKPRGFLVLGCDVHSALGRLRLRRLVQTGEATRYLIKPHTFHYTRADIDDMVREQGFEIVGTNGVHAPGWRTLLAPSAEYLLVARR